MPICHLIVGGGGGGAGAGAEEMNNEQNIQFYRAVTYFLVQYLLTSSKHFLLIFPSSASSSLRNWSNGLTQKKE